MKNWAYSTTIIGVRGDTARKAVNKIADDDRIVHLEVDANDLETFVEIDQDEVPEWARDRIEHEHEKRVQNIEKAISGQ